MSDLSREISKLSPAQRAALKARVAGSQRDSARIPQRADRDSYPLSFTQEAFWLVNELEPGSHYNDYTAFRISGDLNVPVLERAIQEVLRRHEVLRCRFQNEGGKPVQLISPSPSLDLPVKDMAGEPLEKAWEVAREEAQLPFDLMTGPMYRFMLLRLAANEHILLVTMHHIVTDGWSMAVFIQETSQLYEAFFSGKPSPLPELPIQYADYAAWQREFLQEIKLRQALSYWRSQLEGFSRLELASPRTVVEDITIGARHYVDLPQSVLLRVKDLARQESVSVFVILLTVLNALLVRYTGREDIVIGAPVSGRDHEDTQGLIGVFVNTLVIRTKLKRDMTVRELARCVHATMTGAFAHQQLPLATLIRELRPERRPGQAPFFQVVFNSQPTATKGQREFCGLTISPIDPDNQRAAFDLALQLTEETDGIHGRFHYKTSIFDVADIRRIWEHYRNLLESALANPDLHLTELNMVNEWEQQWLVEGAQGKRKDLGPARLLHDEFRKQAAKRGEATAISDENGVVSYRELDRESEKLAVYLQGRGVGAEVLVGVCLERSRKLVMGLLAVVKAGGAYVPLDPVYPKERLEYVVQDAGIEIVLTDRKAEAVLPAGVQRVYLEQSTEWEIASGEAAAGNLDPQNAAYVIYTSGSTGQPKGVVVSHANVWRLLAATEEAYGFGEQDVWTLFHSYAFDFSVWEMWGALLYGGRLVVPGHWLTRSGDEFYQLLHDQGVTVLNQTPSAFRELMRVEQERESNQEALRLRWVIFGGEALDVEILRAWFERHGGDGPKLVNMYGITETTVHVTHRELSKTDAEGAGVRFPIGKPLSDLRVYLLNEEMNLAPIGVVGEIYVGGAGVSRGYLGQADLTAERFMPDEFSAEAGARLYRSGDLARWLGNGELEFLGRRDHQVKIRGFRIELGEIETTLMRHPGIQQCVVRLRNDPTGAPSLVAYCVPAAATAATVKRWLQMEQEGSPANRERIILPNGEPLIAMNRKETEFLYQEIFEDEQYSIHVNSLSPESIIVDVGAHVGVFTLYAAFKFNNPVIYAFEPMPALFEVLQSNCRLYGVNARLSQVALGSEENTAQFVYYPKLTSLSSRYAVADEERRVVLSYLSANPETGDELDELLHQWTEGEALTCRVTTLSRVIDENGIDHIDLLKIDVEKSEWEVLQGIQPSHWPIIRRLVVEVHDKDGGLERIVSYLKERGFAVRVSQTEQLKGTGLFNVHAQASISGASAPPHTINCVESSSAWHAPEKLKQDVLASAARFLPDYMVPSALVLMHALPLTVNGKLDDRSLPDPWTQREWKKQPTDPRTPVEEALMRIWSEVLKRSDFGIEDRFVELGGHSLVATQIIARARREFGIKLPVRAIFDHPTIAGLAETIEHMVIDDIVGADTAARV